MIPAFNVSTRKVGGIRFLKIGRLTISWSVSRAYRPIGRIRPADMPVQVHMRKPMALRPVGALQIDAKGVR